MAAGLPVVVNGLDDEAEGGADGVDVFPHYSLDNCGLACIVEAAASWSNRAHVQAKGVQHTASKCEAPCL